MIKATLSKPVAFEGDTYQGVIEFDPDKLTGDDIDNICRRFEKSLSPAELYSENFNIPFSSREFLKYFVAYGLNQRVSFLKAIPASTYMELLTQARVWVLKHGFSNEILEEDETNDQGEKKTDKTDELVLTEANAKK